MKQHQINYVKERLYQAIRKQRHEAEETPVVKKIEKQIRVLERRCSVLREKARKIHRLADPIPALEQKAQKIMDELVLGDEARAMKMLADFERM